MDKKVESSVKSQPHPNRSQRKKGRKTTFYERNEVRFPRVTPAMLAERQVMFPELVRARRRPAELLGNCTARRLNAALKPFLNGLYPIPDAPYSLYRLFVRTGDRQRFEERFFLRRRNLTVAAAAYFLRPQPELLDATHDYLWAICEESTWILPAHEHGGVDLFACETALWLAETLELLKGRIAAEVESRVRTEIERQVVGPFMAFVGGAAAKQTPIGEANLADLVAGRRTHAFRWFKGRNNWNGVCAGATGAAMLWLESDPRRLARGLNALLDSLAFYLEKAFSADGASDEGVAYWQYGLGNFVIFSELLRDRTCGQINLLAHPRMAFIAQYPSAVLLSPGRFYNPADCSPTAELRPGFAARLAKHTGVESLRGLVGRKPRIGHNISALSRALLWRDDRARPTIKIGDVLLPAGGVFRLRSKALVLAGKAGHNQENHNHNDVGSFVLHCRGEDLLCDPGAPTYNRDFFGPRRYELFPQAQSWGHSLPVIGGKQQAFGREFCGRVERFEPSGAHKSVELEFARAYPLKRLTVLRRRLEIAPGGRFLLEDRFSFSGRPLPVEEALVTWLPVSVKGRTVIIRGRKSTLALRISAPANASFRLERLQLQRQDRESSTLRRLTVHLPADAGGIFRLTGTVRRRG